ncbi:DUF2285 domain-containing protein [Paucibacter sp. PLA-PC-4]|uniref:DUF2285 domain-containing protein n=1 Tax=Paucibacter sp. PLA-PC-4 TaxID=2993655 RepID=UPI00224B8E25|nr:DUF2285 domain-containing protein [Paucibacter sp. PLA-PC-4]MCX2864162.1 DUF2285 domain-containing protein [Paucibacter sp. PLA-PC-4]
MADLSAEPWYATAAYLYVLHLDELALAWCYLRRHPDYRRDWLRRRPHAQAAQRWGLRLLESPDLDARDAHPAWLPGHSAVVQLHPDADPPWDADVFAFWDIAGRKQVLHDGNGLSLVTRSPGRCQRFALAPGLDDGMAVVLACRCGAPPPAAHGLGAAFGVARPRPSPTSLLELHTLQALDATLAGASLREVAEGVFGTEVVAAGWHADGDLRARVRRLVRRGHALMTGGYLRLAHLPPLGEGRLGLDAKRP